MNPTSQIQHVYFPNDCFVSMLTTVDGDRAAEVGLIGSEGMIGVPMALGVARLAFSGRGTRRRHGNADDDSELSPQFQHERCVEERGVPLYPLADDPDRADRGVQPLPRRSHSAWPAGC